MMETRYDLQAPRVGLKPTTNRLTASYSRDWSRHQIGRTAIALPEEVVVQFFGGGFLKLKTWQPCGFTNRRANNGGVAAIIPPRQAMLF
jgi:hypothetical protein